MSEFLRILVQYKTEIQKYFLEWMKLFLDDYSRITLPQLHNKYQETRKVLLQLKNNLHSESNAEIKQLKYKLKVQNKHLAYASFGIEYFFRETGQIYEARMENSDTKEKVIEEN